MRTLTNIHFNDSPAAVGTVTLVERYARAV